MVEVFLQWEGNLQSIRTYVSISGRCAENGSCEKCIEVVDDARRGTKGRDDGVVYVDKYDEVPL